MTYITLSESKENNWISRDPYLALANHFNNPHHTLAEDVAFMERWVVHSVSEATEWFATELNEDYNFIMENLEGDLEKAGGELQKQREAAKKENGFKFRPIQAIRSLIAKSLSLKAENIEKGMDFKYKVLRIALAAFVLGGAIIVPETLLFKLIASIATAAGVNHYTSVRADKTRRVLEASLENLQSKMDDIEDADKLKELKLVAANLETKIKFMDKQMELKERAADKLKSVTGMGN